ncbi:T9SS type A sorting domain-containing protein [candidate division KSB1 bacterium]|nr:T9SS type A sorting domain-containing protein [candidate division KSB1 bacterium]
MKRFFCSSSWIYALQSVLIISWHPNNDTDLKGYKLYYGNESRRYKNVQTVGLDTTCTLENLKGGLYYYFALTAYDFHGNESDYSDEIKVFIEAKQTPLEQVLYKKSYNFPNPFHPPAEQTHLRYFLPNPEYVTIEIYDVNGKSVTKVLDHSYKHAGEHTEDTWDGTMSNGILVQNGVYYCRIKAESQSSVISIVVVK